MSLEPILHIIKNQKTALASWFSKKEKGLKAPLYVSCDLRHSGHKISVVDTNLFPAGFNNLCPTYLKATQKSFENYLDFYHPNASKILLYAESHTRNKFYLKNIIALKNLLSSSKREVRVGMNKEALPQARIEVSIDSDTLELNQVSKSEGKIFCDSFVPDLIISNNDFSAGIPDFFSDLTQPIIPDPRLGWHSRKKSTHFKILENLVSDFSNEFKVDPFQLFARFDSVDVNFDDEKSVSHLAGKVDALLSQITDDYKKRGIVDAPYVYVKSDQGTYGLGLLPVFSGDDVLKLNRKQQNKLTSAKHNKDITTYLIQEGVPTQDFYSGYPLEPVIYAVGFEDIGGFFRIHESKNQWESLNAPGMSFSCLCLHKLDQPHEQYFVDCCEKESVVSVSRFLTRIACIAAAMEL